MNMEFYRCKRCGQIITKITDTGIPVICCGEPMEKLVPGSVDASLEKHVPKYEIRDKKIFVTVGSIDHPMTEDHYIEWIAVQTKNGCFRRVLKPGDAPRASFTLCDKDEVIAVFAYCNLHGLWKA